MLLNQLNPTPSSKLGKISKVLGEEFGVSFKKAFLPKRKLLELKETANLAVVKLRNSNKKFQLEPEYAKFLGIRDAIDVMLAEGMYAESPAYMEMKGMISDSVRQLMDSGYTMDEACTECMNRYRMDNRFAYDDDTAKTIVIKAAKDYMDECGSGAVMASAESIDSDLNERLLSELAKEIGVEIVDTSSYDAIEETLGKFAEVSGKSRDSVVGFLNGLEEDAVVSGIQMFGRKIAERKLNDSIQYMHKLKKDGKSIEDIAKELGMKPEEVTDAMNKTESKKSNVKEEFNSMFDDILSEMISEEVNVEEAEVVMAVRALADDIQDQVERLGRMMNEDLPAIADQVRGEMGGDKAVSFSDNINGLLSQHLEATKAIKTGFDQAVAELSGEGFVAGGAMADTGDLGGDDLDTGDMGLGEPEGDLEDNIPASAGPEEEPLGRAEI
jgi:viroplasmin and RNaseH domain-containing protein